MRDFIEEYSDKLSRDIKTRTFNLDHDFKYDAKIFKDRVRVIKDELFLNTVDEKSRWDSFAVLVDELKKLQNAQAEQRINNQLTHKDLYLIENVCVFAEELSQLWLLHGNEDVETPLWPNFVELLCQGRALLDPITAALAICERRFLDDPHRDFYLPIELAVAQARFFLGIAIKPAQSALCKQLKEMDLEAFYWDCYCEDHLTGGLFWAFSTDVPDHAKDTIQALKDYMEVSSGETNVVAKIIALRESSVAERQYTADVMDKLLLKLGINPEKMPDQIYGGYLELMAPSNSPKLIMASSLT